MAEIKIEKKETLIWPWVLLALLIIAALLYFFVFRDNDENIDQDADTVPVVVVDSPRTNSVNNTNNSNGDSEVNNYVSFINTDTATMGIDHVFTNLALNRLIDATKATAERNDFDITADLAQAKESAEKITNDPMDVNHANLIKKVTGKISTALQNMQQAKFPNLTAESNKLKEDSRNISTADLTLDQKKTVKTFFNDAADLLKKMN